MQTLKTNELFQKMIAYYKGDPKRIQHFTKVYCYAKLIGQEEHLPEHTLFILETAAIVHDIGIKTAEQEYGRSDGKLQERLGPAIAQEMLAELCYAPDVVERVCFLVGHHHTYDRIDGLDYQILVEADFLVNLYEDEAGKGAAEAACHNIFRTETGKRICREMYQL